MKKQQVGVVVDGTIDYIKGIKEEDLLIAKVHVFRNEKEVELTKEEFYKEIIDYNNKFTTSQGNPEDFLKAYNNAKKELIVITLTSRLSGTYNSAVTASKQVKDCRVTVIDSLSTSAGLGILAKTAVEGVRNGKTYDEVVKSVKELIPKIRIYLVVGSLDYLIKGGRVSKTIGALGKIIKLKPVLELTNGELKSAGKMLLFNDLVKGFHNFIRSKMKNLKKVYIVHNNMKEETKELKSLLNKDYDVEVIKYVTPVLGVHLGPQAIVAGWIEE